MPILRWFTAIICNRFHKELLNSPLSPFLSYMPNCKKEEGDVPYHNVTIHTGKPLSFAISWVSQREPIQNHVQGKREDHDRYQTACIVIYFSCIRWVLRPVSSGKEI